MDQAKKDAEQLKNDLKSDDPATRKAAEQKVEEMKKQAGQNAAGQQRPDPKEIEQAVKDMKSGDPEKQKQGREKLEQQLGKDARNSNRQLGKEAVKQAEKDLRPSRSNRTSVRRPGQEGRRRKETSRTP